MKRGRKAIAQSPWTPALDGKLRELYAAAWSYTEIAEKLGHGITRSSVAGRIHKLKLPHKGSAKSINTGVIIPEPAPMKVVTRPSDGFKAGFSGKGISLLTVRHDQCRWPYDGKAGDGYPQCCGEPVVEGLPFCLWHCRAGYQSVRAWRDHDEVAA